MELTVLTKRFMDTAIADILRAANGGAAIGSSVLAMCAIDALSYLRSKRTSFKDIVSGYLSPIDSRYLPAEIYAMRCVLVHAHGGSKGLGKARLDGCNLVYGQPEIHLTRSNGALTICVDRFIADVCWAAHAVLESFLSIRGRPTIAAIERRADSIVVRRSGFEIVAGYDADKEALSMRYFDMHPALGAFDAPAPDLGALRAAVWEVYRPLSM